MTPVRVPSVPRVDLRRLVEWSDAFSEGQSLEDVHVHGDFTDANAEDVAIERVIFDRATFIGATLRRIRLIDAVMDNCDLSGADLEAASLLRVEFRNCRLSGVLLPRARLRDVTFSGCRINDANLRMLDGERVLFANTDLHESEFIGAKLLETRLHDCKLDGVQFSGVEMPGAELHGSSLDGIKGAASLRGVVIDSTQVLPLAVPVFAALDIRIIDDRAERASD